MTYLVIKEFKNQKGLFIPASTLAKEFNRKEEHVEAKLKAIMYITEEPSIFDIPFRKTLTNNKSIYIDLDNNGKINVYSNKELTEYVLSDWKTRNNTQLIDSIIKEFDRAENELSMEETKDIPEVSVMEDYHTEVEIYENIENCTVEDTNIINDVNIEPVKIEMTEVSGRYLLTASELFMALKLGDLYDFERWSNDNIVHNSMYAEGVDYEECETYNPETNPHFFTDYIIDSNVARELISITDSTEKVRVRNHIASFSLIPNINNEDYSEFINNIKLNIYYIERYLPSVLNWKTAEEIMPKLLDRCMEEIDSGNIKVEVFSAVIRTALKIVDREKDSTKKELLNKQITEWMIKRAQIYAGIISSVKTENARLKEQLTCC